MDLELQGKVVLVTGGSSGIGRATATAFGNEGARVALTFHSDRAAGEKAVGEVDGAGGEGLLASFDLADPASINEAVSSVVDRWGGLDVLVANAVDWPESAGWAPPRFEEVPEQTWGRALDTGLHGTFRTLQAALPAMRGRSGGRIVLLSSGVAEYGMPGDAGYGAAKAGVHGLCRSLARELGADGILVNVLMPGLTTTERNLSTIPGDVRQTVAEHVPSGRLSRPDDVANAAVFLGSAANSNISGETVRVGQ